MSPPRPAPHRPGPARPPLPRTAGTRRSGPAVQILLLTRATIFTSQTGKIFLQKHRQVHFLHLFQRGWGPRPQQPDRSLGWTSSTLHRIGAPTPPRAAVCRVNKSLIYLRADFQRRAELRITKYFPHMGPGRLGWRRGSGRPGNLKLSQINLNPNEAWRQRRSKISFRNTFEEIKSSQKNHLPFCLRVVQQRPAGAQRVSDLMIHTNEQFLWLLEPLEL